MPKRNLTFLTCAIFEARIMKYQNALNLLYLPVIVYGFIHLSYAMIIVMNKAVFTSRSVGFATHLFSTTNIFPVITNNVNTIGLLVDKLLHAHTNNTFLLFRKGKSKSIAFVLKWSKIIFCVTTRP